MLATDELFIAVFGNVRRQQVLDEDPTYCDPYRAFNTYASVLGWGGSESSDKAPCFPPLWEMEEAGGDWDTREGQPRSGSALWVQVGLPNRTGRIIVPIVQIVACAEKVLMRKGFDNLSDVQLMIPLGCGPIVRPSWIAPLFEFSRTRSATTLRYEIDGGEDNSCLHYAQQIIEEANRGLARDGIRFQPPDVVGDSSYLLQEPGEMSRDAWMGRSTGRIKSEVSIPEAFSFDIAAHLAAHVARSCQKLGVRSHILTTASLRNS
ncbi:hypothetical protein [Rhodococcus opacus]|uniref:hypothetical protein n=1 Tax=Rhodococcus opacus TaxID=37919 RepID=UPI000A4AAFF8|nr:hypothetical protein [Rhodococcus opacus]